MSSAFVAGCNCINAAWEWSSKGVKCAELRILWLDVEVDVELDDKGEDEDGDEEIDDDEDEEDDEEEEEEEELEMVELEEAEDGEVEVVDEEVDENDEEDVVFKVLHWLRYWFDSFLISTWWSLVTWLEEETESIG